MWECLYFPAFTVESVYKDQFGNNTGHTVVSMKEYTKMSVVQSKVASCL